MNYRHAFHAGNFADLLKHGMLTALLAQMTRDKAALTVIDTHAGAGVYDLQGDLARRTGEGSAIGVLMADESAPAAFDALKTAVRRLNDGCTRYYPGSPDLISAALRPRDRLIACETRRDDFLSLSEVLRHAGAVALRQDGWDVASARTPAPPAPVLVHIDPPYEAANDGERAAQTVDRVLRRNARAVIAVWAPIKDLTAFDALVMALEDAAQGRSLLVAEVRLRPPDDPLRLNGCAMITVNATPELRGTADVVASWISGALGETGAVGRAAPRA